MERAYRLVLGRYGRESSLSLSPPLSVPFHARRKRTILYGVLYRSPISETRFKLALRST